MRNIRPILNALPVFEAAARSCSFTRAAKSLGMAQPSVSRYIAILEDQLGVALFERKNNEVLLTPEGEQFFEAVKLGLGHIRNSIENLDGVANANILTVVCSQGFAHQWFLPRRANLLAYLQGYEVHLATSGLPTGGLSRENDIEFRFGSGVWENCEAHLLFNETVFVVCSPAFASHNNLTGHNLDLQSIQNLPLLVQDRGEMGWMDWQNWFRHFGGEFMIPKDQYLFNNYALTMQAAMEGKGIALAWEGLADSYLSNNWLVALNGMSVGTDKGYYLVFSPNNPVAEGLRQWASSVVKPGCN